MYIPLEKDERIILQVHRHWFFLVTHAILLVIVLMLPCIAWWVLVQLGVVVAGAINPGAVWVLILLWSLVGWTLYFKFFTLYWLDVWVITNKRVIDVDYKRLFDRDIAMLRIERVEDVQVRVRGVLGNLLRFGSVSVQSAGAQREFVIDQIATPETVRDAILTYSGTSSGSN